MAYRHSQYCLTKMAYNYGMKSSHFEFLISCTHLNLTTIKGKNWSLKWCKYRESCCLFIKLNSAWTFLGIYIYSPIEIWWHVRRYPDYSFLRNYYMRHHIWLNHDLQNYLAKEIKYKEIFLTCTSKFYIRYTSFIIYFYQLLYCNNVF